MIEFTTFDVHTGELLQTMRCTEIQGVDLQCSDDVSYVFGHWDKANHVVRDGEVIVRDGGPALIAPPSEPT